MIPPVALEKSGGGTNTGDSTDGTGDGTNTGDNTGGSEGSGDGAVTGDTTGGSEGTVTPAEGGETSTDKTGGGSQETGDLSDTEKQEEKKEGQENEEGNTEDSKENGFNITNNLKQEIETIDIPVTKTWVDGNNADHTRPDSIDVYLYVNGEKDETRKLTLTAPEDNPGADVWTGVFEHLPKFDSDGKEISYEVKEVTVDGYTSVVERGESISGYDYPENISYAEIDQDTVVTPSVAVTNGYDWMIEPGLRSDEIAGTKVVFNNNNMNVINTPFTEYDAKGNLVPTNERFFSIGSYNGREFIMYNPSKDPDNKNKTSIGSLIEISHYLEFRFEDAVTILDGTANGTTADVIMTVNNISVVRTNTSNSTQQRILSMVLGSVWAQSGGIGANSMDINFKVSGVNEGTVLLSFADIDVTDSPFTDRRETVYLMDGFDHTVYALPLGNSTSTDHKESNAEPRKAPDMTSWQSGPFTEFRVIESEGTPIFRARALRQDGSLGDWNGTLQSGFVARANLSENGFSLRWTGSDCGTGMFTQVKPFKVKATVDENISGFVGGSITNPTNWVYRDYGKPLVYTITPDNGYHISYLKLNGTAVDLINGFDEKGEMTVNTGWTKTQDPNNINDATENIKLYQRENGVVDVVLPAQYYAVLDTAPARVDHWIDTSFASNGTASSYEITNTLTTSITGGKTWIAGAKAHIDNSELSFNLTRDGKAYQFNPSQMTWNADGTYVLSGLPKYAADGHEYIYVLEENVPAGYDGKKDGNNFINTLKQENITIQGKKTWNDGGRTHNNAADVVITLKRASTTDGVNYGSPETLDLVPVWEGDTYKFSNLPKYDAARFEYRYTVEETLSDAFLATLAEGETYTSTTDETGRNFVNTPTVETTFTGTKIWIAGAKAHIDNSELSFNLTRDGKAYQFNPSQMTWNADGTYVLSKLPKYAADGHQYAYVLEENVPAGYDGTKDGNNFINTLKQEDITVQGKKTWKDGGRTHDNAADVVITLKRATTTDGVNYGSPETLDLMPVWEGDTYKFSNLPKYDDARFEYRYTVEEKLSDAFLATLAEGETYTSTTDDTGRNFVNTLTGKPKTTFTGTKIWSDGKTHNNDDEITLVLYWESAAISKRNTGLKRGTGEELQKGEYRLEWTGNTFTFSGLPKYDNEGNPYTYSVRESYIKNEQTGNVSTQTKDTDYTVLYDGKVWDFDSYKTEADAYKETAYTTIENRITPLVIRKTVPRQTQNPEKKTVRVRIYVPNTGAEQIGILEREHTFYYLIVCLCLVVMTVSGGYLVYSHRKENR